VTKTISKTKAIAIVKDLDWKALKSALAEQPSLLDTRGRRGENLLHLCCGVDSTRRRRPAANSIKTAGVLLDAGLDVNAEAFREGEWKATPLWYAVARGKNTGLVKYLFSRGASPEHSLWAAAYNDDPAAVRLLCAAGATIDPQGSETPLMFAVKWSRFAAAKALLACGANANYQDANGKTALHYMLKKRSDAKYIRTFLEHGASIDLKDREGTTVRTLLSRARDPRYRALAG
jgi:uncharacterized protein